MSNGAKFKAAVERNDLDGMLAVLSPDVVFHTPVRFHAVPGKDATTQILKTVMEIFEDFTYTDHLESEGVSIIVFRARVGDRDVEGVDILRDGDDGLVADFTVIVRPLSGLQALGEAMGRGLGLIPSA